MSLMAFPTIERLSSEFILERDHFVEMDDGVRLAANLFRATGESPRPAIVSVTPYCKDRLPDAMSMLIMRLFGVRFGKLQCSRWTGFEAPDPEYWVNAGYVVVQVDVRGMYKSGGSMGVLTQRDAEDYKQVIAWVARQPWCDGNVGLLGVSYLAMSQWRVAALRPPALRAICPWEGATDLLREFAYQDGIPETGFLPIWWKRRMLKASRGGPHEEFMAMRRRTRSTALTGEKNIQRLATSTCPRSSAAAGRTTACTRAGHSMVSRKSRQNINGFSHTANGNGSGFIRPKLKPSRERSSTGFSKVQRPTSMIPGRY